MRILLRRVLQPHGASRDNWGRWVVVKDNAASLLAKREAGALDGKLIYMSSVTDPYQPIERELYARTNRDRRTRLATNRWHDSLVQLRFIHHAAQ